MRGSPSVRRAVSFDPILSSVCRLGSWSPPLRIAAWKAEAEHARAQQEGRDRWYSDYALRIARVERAYDRAASTFGAET
jgi:hypothetical protein